MEQLIRTTLDADGVLLATIDMPGRAMNVFSAELMDALEALMDRVDAEATIRSVVLASGKPSFLAGADLEMVRGYCDAAHHASREQMFELCGRLGRQFVRLEASTKPWIAAVNGLALGGGLELAMACRARIVADDPGIQLGLPEVRLGLMPGAGGTQRLPRHIGFESAMPLLLSGRSLAPVAAVACGLFERTVPAARLLDEAKAAARRLHGTAYDPQAKFPHLAQTDVPAYSPEVSCAIASKHGVDVSDLDRYPAYSAITDSVLLGARLPLAEANAIEMRQFLRLMFSPVAGKMVRTLFLERQRAERALAPPQGLRIEKIGVGAISPARFEWADALAGCRLPMAEDAELAADTIELFDSLGARHRVTLRVLGDAGSGEEPAGAFAVLTPGGRYGRVLDIVGAGDAAAGVLAVLAKRLSALPYRSIGSRSALLAQARANPDDADAQALAALHHAATSTVASPTFYDVAACAGGVAPAWSGGPFTHLWHEHARLAARFDGEAAKAWAMLEPVLREAKP